MKPTTLGGMCFIASLLFNIPSIALAETQAFSSIDDIFLDSQKTPLFLEQFNSESTPSDLKPQLVEIASKKTFNAKISDNMESDFSLQSMDALDSGTIEIHEAGASFIKVHFSQLSLPEGAQIIVRNPDATQQHVYGAGASTSYTLASDSDDGVNAFSALSVIGDTAIIEYVANGADDSYEIDIDHYMQGYPEDQMMSAMNSADDFGVLSTCGVNERRDVQCWANSHPEEFERSRPVARLLINGSSLCTAWRVGSSNRMFTNNHCVSSTSGVQSTEVWFNYQRTGCGSGSTSSTTIVSGSSMLATDYTLDYTLFTVSNFNSISSFGYFGLDVRDAINQEQIFIPQHGSGNPKELAIESDQNSGGVCRVDDPFTNGRGSNTDIGYYCDTIGGSSGSPVLASSTNKVIALHHLGGCMNTGARMNLIWPQVSSHFGGVIPDGDNGDGGGGGGGGGGDDTTEIANGQAINGISGSQGSESFYVMNVPAGATDLSFSISGGSGDADLYVRAGSKPTTGSYDCRPYLNGNNESCSLDNVSGEVYVMLRAYSSFSGVSLIGSYEDGNGGGGGGGADSGTHDNLSGTQGDWQDFSVDVPQGASSLSISISGGSGDADLYVRYGQEPTSSSYDCRPYRNGNSEQCQFNNPNAGTWYYSLRAYRNYSGVDITWSYE